MLQEDSHAHHCEKLNQAVTSMEVSQFMENHCVVSDQQFLTDVSRDVVASP